MPDPLERIEGEIRTALKGGDRERLAVLRLLLDALTNERIRRRGPVDEAGFLSLVRKAIKQRREAATLFRQGGREELAAKEEREAGILEGYLPPPADEAEVRSAVEAFVASEGLSGPAAMGTVMRAMLERFAGRVDGGALSRIVRDVLAGG